MKGIIKRILGIGGVGCIALLSSSLYASGYKMEFQSPSVLADGGDAAVVEDAGTNWYNSAGLVYLPQQLVVGGMYVYNPTTFTGTSIAPSIVAPGFATFVANGDSGSYNNVVTPAIHYSLPINDCYAFGLSIVPAWGLLENFGDNTKTRYDLVRIYTKSIDIAPSIAFKLGPQFSIGIGPDAHYWSLSSKSHVRTQPLTTGDSIARFSGDDWGYGGHIGVLYRPDDCTRIGLNYRSKMVMTLNGYSDFVFFNGLGLESNNFRVKFALPPITALSFYRDINPCWAIMGTIYYEQWSTIRNLHGINFMGPTGTSSVVLPQDYNNTFDFALGAHYRLNPKLLFRASAKYLQTPTITRNRDINFPDQAKLGLNFGARYQLNCKVAIDLVYAHVFIRHARINHTTIFRSNLNGHISSSVDIAGAQIVWNI